MDRLETREFESFVAVAEEHSFSKAARRLHLSQPPLSRHIASLEEKLGVRLFERNTRNVELTPAGTVFLEDIRMVLRQVERATSTLRLASDKKFSRLNIGFVGALVETGMVRYLQQFRRSHPHCIVRLHDMCSPDLIQAVKNDDLDGAFIGTAPSKLPAGVQMVSWKQGSYEIALSRQHPLASHKELVLKDLARENWIMISRRVAPTYYQTFIDLCTKAGFRPRITYESDSQRVILAMIAVEEGICLAPENMQRSFPNIVFRPLCRPRIKLDFPFIFRKSRQSELLQELVRTLKRGRHKYVQVTKEGQCQDESDR